MQITQGQTTRAPARAPSTVAREIMYAANRYSDAQLDSRDADVSKLGAALLQLSGKQTLTESDLRTVVSEYAGRDGRVGPGEMSRLQDDVQAITDHLEARQPNWPANRPADMSARWLMARGDVNADGVINARDIRAGSDYASVMISEAGIGRFDVESVQAAAQRMYPGSNPDTSVQRFIDDVNAGVAWWINNRGGTLADRAHADVRVFDTNEDLRLTAEDGRSARITLKLVGQSRAATVNDVLNSYRTFDTPGPDGTPDGRIDTNEYLAWAAARRKVADTVPHNPAT